jgi:multidrug efflux pump
MKKYTIKYGNIPVTKQKVCCKITGTVQKTIIKKWNISDKIIVEVYRYMENELFEKAPVHKAYFNMALPLVFSMVISLVYNMVDTFFIARTGNTNLVAGVSLGAPMFTAMIALGDIFGLGGSSMIARLFGQRKDEDAKRISSFCFYGAIICGVIVTVLLLIFRAPMLHLLGADANTYKYASQYYTYLVLGSVFIIVSFTPNNQLRSEGFSKASMEGSVLGAVVNIILDPIFIYAFNLGVKGAAIATVISQFASAIFTILFLTSDKSVLKLKFKNFKLNFKILLPCLLLGLSPFIMQFTEAIISICFNSSLQKYGGDIAVGSMTILSSLMQFSMLPIMGLSQGAQPVISYNYGAKSSSRVKQAFKILLISSLSYSVVLWLSLMLFPSGFAKIFTTDKELIEYTIWAIHIYFATSGLFGIQIACQQTFVAIGNAKVSLFLAVLRKILLLIPLIFFLPLICNNEVLGVLLAEPIADGIAVTVTGIAFLIIFTKTIKELDKNNLVNE